MRLGRRASVGAAAVAAAAALLVALPFAAPGLARRAWQRAYPVLPARIQALPYLLEARVAPRVDTPVPLPTAPSSVAPAANAATATPAAGAVERSAASPAPVDEGAGASGLATRSHPTPIPPRRVTATGEPPPPPPARATLAPIRHAYQTWNNCGPATVAMALSAFGEAGDQRDAALRLKPDPDDRNVSPDELARYARERGYRADVVAGGDIDLLQRLIAAGAAVIVEVWFVPEPGDAMGHYRLLTGYDADGRAFRAADSYEGPDVVLPWDAFDRDWRAFNRTLVAIYPESSEGGVARAMGDRSGAAMWLGAAATAREELAGAEDAFAWFNLGTSLVGLGDVAAAAEAYDRARALGLPWRMLWYQFGPYEAYGAVGRWDDVEALADSTLHNVNNLEESLYWRGLAREARADAAGARADWERALLLNPLWSAPRAALERLASGE